MSGQSDQKRGKFRSNQRITDRLFGLSLGAVFGTVAAWSWFGFAQFLLWATLLSGILLTTGLLFPSLLMPLNRLWAALFHRIGQGTNTILLGAFFYFVIVPFGMTARIFGRQSMAKAPDTKVESYWTPVQRHAAPDNYPDLF